MSEGDLVYIESPYAKSESGTVEDHVEYAKLCMLDCFKRGEFPFVSHLLYPQVLDDLTPKERKKGMKAGEVWATYADLRVVYTDQGKTRGMMYGIRKAGQIGQKIEHRSLWEEETDNSLDST